MWPQQFLPGDATVTQVLTVSLHCWFWREQISQSRLRGITSRKHLVAQLRQGSLLPHPFHVGAAKHYPLLVIASFLASPWLCFSHGKKKKKKKSSHKGIIFNLYWFMKHRSRTEHLRMWILQRKELFDLYRHQKNASYHGIMASVCSSGIFKYKQTFMYCPRKFDAEVINRINIDSHFLIINYHNFLP